METREIRDSKVEGKGGSFFYEQWKRLNAGPTSPEKTHPESSQHIPSDSSYHSPLSTSFENQRSGGVWASKPAWAQSAPKERHLRAVEVDPVQEAKKSLDRYKQRLKEYRECQGAHLALVEFCAASNSEADKAKAQKKLRILDSRLDHLENELRHGYRRTKSAVQEIRQAS